MLWKRKPNAPKPVRRTDTRCSVFKTYDGYAIQRDDTKDWLWAYRTHAVGYNARTDIRFCWEAKDRTYYPTEEEAIEQAVAAEARIAAQNKYNFDAEMREWSRDNFVEEKVWR